MLIVPEEHGVKVYLTGSSDVYFLPYTVDIPHVLNKLTFKSRMLKNTPPYFVHCDGTIHYTHSFKWEY
ncbi:MAG: hypothetical protein IJH63_10125 [Methanobrevibacter sp.]|nr:hypothetical protein [Methanosphaera sp.]MBR0371055.1 hypothetical protein [Methanobrevibacter sp.]